MGEEQRSAKALSRNFAGEGGREAEQRRQDTGPRKTFRATGRCDRRAHADGPCDGVGVTGVRTWTARLRGAAGSDRVTTLSS